MDVVMTALFTKLPDPARGTYLIPEIATIQELYDSVRDCKLVIFHDEMEIENYSNVIFECVDSGTNVHFQRFIVFKDWLEKHPEVDKVWCVDGTDTEMLHLPFNEQEDGVLYVGSESQTVGNPWLFKEHPSIRPFISEHGDLKLLNCGLIGGDRSTVLEFLNDFVAGMPDAVTGGDSFEMGLFNFTLYTKWAFRFITGEKVHTIFGAWQRDDKVAWWRHK